MTGVVLPSWTYSDPAFLAREREAVFLKTWQLVGHESEIPKPGDYLRFDLLGQSALVTRGDDGRLVAFHNVCRHRGFQLVDGRKGHCAGIIQCRYHGFSYDLSGRLVGVPGEADFPGLDRAEHGLVPVELEIFLGLVFIRFGGTGPGIAAQLAPYRDMLAAYRLPDMRPIFDFSRTEIKANWKVAIENNIEAFHVAVAHPGLQRLYGRNYRFELQPLGVSHSQGMLTDRVLANWSERHYLKLLPEIDYLPPERRRMWCYYSLFPNLAFDVYPDLIDFFQIIPIDATRSEARLQSYAVPDARPEMRAARYLNMRINAQVGREDKHLVEGVQAGLQSSGYKAGLLSRRENRLRQFHAMLLASVPL